MKFIGKSSIYSTLIFSILLSLLNLVREINKPEVLHLNIFESFLIYLTFSLPAFILGGFSISKLLKKIFSTEKWQDKTLFLIIFILMGLVIISIYLILIALLFNNFSIHFVINNLDIGLLAFLIYSVVYSILFSLRKK